MNYAEKLKQMSNEELVETMLFLRDVIGDKRDQTKNELLSRLESKLFMEEYAQQRAEAFAEWIEENNWFKAVAKNTWICLATDEEFTTSELYQKYLENKRKEKLCQQKK